MERKDNTMKTQCKNNIGRKFGIAGILIAVSGLCTLGTMIQCKISPEMAFTHLMHIVVGSIICIGIYLLGFDRLIKWGKRLLIPLAILMLYSAFFNGYCQWRIFAVGAYRFFAPGLWVPALLCLCFVGFLHKNSDGLSESPLKKILFPLALISLGFVGLLILQKWYSFAVITILFVMIFFVLMRFNVWKLIGTVCVWAMGTVIALFAFHRELLLKPYMDRQNLYTANIAEWIMEKSQWMGKGFSELNSISIHIPFQESDMVIMTGILEYGKIYLVAAILFFVIFLISAGVLIGKINNPVRRFLVEGMTAILALSMALSLAVQFGYIPTFATSFPFISCGYFCTTILSFAEIGCIFAALRNDDTAECSCKQKIFLLYIVVSVLPAVGAYFMLKGTECRMPSSFLLHRIEKQKNPTDIPVYDVFFSHFTKYGMQKYLKVINRELPDDIEKNSACTAQVATRSFATCMTEAEMKALVREFQKHEILNHFVFHKRFTDPQLPAPLGFRLERFADSAEPRTFSASLREQTTQAQWEKIKTAFAKINRVLDANEMSIDKKKLLLSDTLTDGLPLQEMNTLVKELYQRNVLHRIDFVEKSKGAVKTESPAKNDKELLQQAIESYNKGKIRQGKRLFFQLAKRNNPDGLLNLGKLCYNDKDYESAAWLFQKSIDLGNEEAKLRLGVLKVYKTTVPQDYPGAFRLLKPFADAKNPDACWAVGCMYANGQGVEKNEEEALRNLRIAAYGGGPDYKLLYAAMLLKKKNRTESETVDMLHILEILVENEYVSAATQLGIIYAEGIPFVPVDNAKAYHYFLKSELLRSDEITEYNLGMTLERHIDSKENLDAENSLPVFYWYKLAESKGHINASGRLGLLYYALGNFAEARRYLTPRAEAGEATPITTLRALNIFEAEGKDKGTSGHTAKTLFEAEYKKAVNGDIYSVLTLAKYFMLRGKASYTPDYSIALPLFRHAVKNGDIEARFRVGSIDTAISDEWKKYSGDAFAKELQTYFNSFIWRNNAEADLRNIQAILNGTGLTMLDETLQCCYNEYGTYQLFSVICVRELPAKKTEYYWLLLEENSARITYMTDTAKFLYQWTDQGNSMIAYRTDNGKIVITGLASTGLSGEYYGNDGKYNTPIPEFPYARGDFKKSHKRAINSFIPRLKHLIKENKRAEIAELIKYPIELDADTLLAKKLNTPDEFLRNFDSIFSSDFIQRIMNTPDDELFTTWEGVGVGQGLLWICPGGDRNNETVKICRFENRLLKSILSATKQTEKGQVK